MLKILSVLFLASCASCTLIEDDRGGNVLKYALKARSFIESGTSIRIKGYCTSACTLYLSLPPDKICIYPGTTFRFHQPFGGTPEENAQSKQYLISQYPLWVRMWLDDNGGLTNKLKVMPWSYSRRFIRPC